MKNRFYPVPSFLSLTMLSTAMPSAKTDPVRRLIFPNPLTLSDSERKVQGKTCFSFFLTTCVRSIALFPLQISFEAPVRWISSEAHFTCAQKRLGYLKSQLLLLDFNQNWERVDKAWCKFPMPNVRNNNGSLCVLCGQSGRHVEAEACIYDGSLRPR